MRFIRSMSVGGWAAVALAFAMTHDARAGLIDFSTPDSSLPATAGNGLVGTYYRPTGGFEAGSLANVNSYIAGHGADATFVSTGVNYGGVYGTGNAAGDGFPVSTFLGSDAGSLIAKSGSPSGETTSQVLANTLDGTMYIFSGYLAITAADINTPQTFFLGSDDGGALYIQGQQVVSNDGDHGFEFMDGGNTVDFTTAGLYSIEILYFEDGGSSGVELGSSFAGSGVFGGELTAADFYQTDTTGTTTSVTPEPSSLTLMGTGVAIACGFLRRRILNA